MAAEDKYVLVCETLVYLTFSSRLNRFYSVYGHTSGANLD
jgi:hypothetical protein